MRGHSIAGCFVGLSNHLRNLALSTLLALTPLACPVTAAAQGATILGAGLTATDATLSIQTLVSGSATLSASLVSSSDFVPPETPLIDLQDGSIVSIARGPLLELVDTRWATPLSAPLLRFGADVEFSLGGAFVSLTPTDGVACAGVLRCLERIGEGALGGTFPHFDVFPGPDVLTSSSGTSLRTSHSDLVGTWRVHTLLASTTRGIPGDWLTGSLTIGRGSTGGALLDSWGRSVTPEGAVASSSDTPSRSILSGTISTESGPLGFSLFTTTAPNADDSVVVGAGAFVHGLLDVAPAWNILVRNRDGFAPSDAAGEWRLLGVTVPAAPDGAGAWLDGTMTVEPNGRTTGTLGLPGRTVTISDGALTVSAGGALTGTLGVAGDAAIVDGTMMTRGAAIGVVTGRWVNGVAGPDLGLVALVRPPSTPVGVELAGRWHVFGLSVLAADGSLGTSLVGFVELDASGTVVGGTLVDVTGAEHPLDGGRVSVDTGGRVTGALLAPGLGAIDINGSVAGDMVLGRTTLADDDAAVTAYGLVALVRDASWPVLVTTPAAVDFGKLVVGTRATLGLTISNHGRERLDGSVRSSAPYRVVSGGSVALERGESQTVVVAFEPTAAGLFAGALTIDWQGGSAQRGLLGSAVSPATLSVSRAGPGSGMVRSEPSGIECGPRCAALFAGRVTLQAEAAPGSVFAGWSGACSGLGPCTVTMGRARSVRARFLVARPGTLTVRKSGAGTGTVASVAPGITCGRDCSERYAGAQVVTLTAIPGDGSTFVGWQGACQGTGTCAVTINGARTVIAMFGRPPRSTQSGGSRLVASNLTAVSGSATLSLSGMLTIVSPGSLLSPAVLLPAATVSPCVTNFCVGPGIPLGFVPTPTVTGQIVTR